MKHELPVQYQTEGSGTPKSLKRLADRAIFLQNVANYLETEIIIIEETHTTLTLQLKRKITPHYFILQLKKEAFVAHCLSTMGFPKIDEIWTK